MSVSGKIGKAMKGKLTKTRLFKEAEEANLYNGYTGLKTTHLATAAVGGIAGTYALATSHPGVVGYNRQKQAADMNKHYVGSTPAQQADGVMNAPTLGASGDMVFGLNNMRRG